jgi:methyl-accepting chemotaxis protein
MKRQRTLGTQLGLGFATIMLLAIATGVVSILTLRTVVDAKDDVIVTDAPKAIDTQTMRAMLERKSAAARGYLLTREARFLQTVADMRREIVSLAERIRPTLDTDEGRRMLESVVRLEGEHQLAFDDVVALRQTDATPQAVSDAFETRVVPKRDALDAALREVSAFQLQRLEKSRAAASDTASTATTVLIAIVIATIVLGLLLSWLLSRRLSRQIGSAVGQVQSSSAELQAAANQQATGAKEQATAMAEITTTITELLATSRQIAESAQRVAQIAGQTASSAGSGGTTVEHAHASIAAIRQQVDLVVAHMLELGKKSQEIGAVLDLVSELAEQTNILAINATIEAAGAGDAGKRFAVVADEIRKLADRVAGSTKQIRGLIDDVRGAVNTTVMATESGSKAVDSGAKQFEDVASVFKQIANLVVTTTEAAREIELSTKQQTSAVEQVNVAIASVAQATKETEASSSQTLLTAGQLTTLSSELLELVEPAQGR